VKVQRRSTGLTLAESWGKAQQITKVEGGTIACGGTEVVGARWISAFEAPSRAASLKMCRP